MKAHIYPNFDLLKYFRHFRHLRHFEIIALLLFPSQVYPQKLITLKECYEKAYAVSPVSRENKTYTNIWQLKDRNLSKGWLPTLDANGSFVYNSSVVDMSEVLGSLPVPGIAGLIHPLPHEQYKVTLDINQMIYDGGAVKSQRALEKADLDVSRMQTESDLYKLRGQINSCYFNLLLLERQKELLTDYLEVIKKRLVSVRSAAESGVAKQSDMDVLDAERIKLMQQLSENNFRKQSFQKILSGLTGMTLNDTVRFQAPAAGFVPADELTRPELKVFDLRKVQLDASLQLVQSKRMPKAFGFATLGYGNPPGSNFFKDKFAPYYIIGAGVKWNVFDWNKVNNEKEVIMFQQSILEDRKNDLTDNLERLLSAKNAEILILKNMLETDRDLVGIRKRVTAAAESQYENGTITATDYLNELNAERQALINAEIHTISLSLAVVEYLNTSGKEIE
jgi:outer membrane protein TolC